MKYYLLYLIGISISLNACSTASIEQKPTLNENRVVKPLPTACPELKKSVESKQAELREILNFDRQDNDESVVARRKENIARLNDEIISGIREYIKTCTTSTEK
jgi:hypothetical protein